MAGTLPNRTIDISAIVPGLDGKVRPHDPLGIQGGVPKLTLINYVGSSGDALAGWTKTTHDGAPIWRSDSYVSSPRGPVPRFMQKLGYGQTQNPLTIDATTTAPLRSEAGVLLVEESSSIGQAAAWLWYDSMGFNRRFPTEWVAGMNRLSVYVKTTGINPLAAIAEDGYTGGNFHVGTYCCWEDSDFAASGEGPNCHFYHYGLVDPDGWVHVQLDNHPTYRREVSVSTERPLVNPLQQYGAGREYFQDMIAIYMENRYTTGSASSLWFDNMELYAAPAGENNMSIANIFLGYYPELGEWKLMFQDTTGRMIDGVRATGGRLYFSTFEVRWSLSPITEDNFDYATLIEPSGTNNFGGVARSGHPNRIRKLHNSVLVLTRFSLPAGTEASNERIYFAIKDVSVLDGNVGSMYPWNGSGDWRNAYPGIRTIDYVFGGE